MKGCDQCARVVLPLHPWRGHLVCRDCLNRNGESDQAERLAAWRQYMAAALRNYGNQCSRDDAIASAVRDADAALAAEKRRWEENE